MLGKDKSFKPVIEYAINQSDVVTAVSESLKEETIRHFNISNKINMVPNFIDMSLYKQHGSTSLRNRYAKNGEYILTHISNFRKVKRISDVINIFKKVHDEIPCVLLMIGDGPDRFRAEQLSRELGISSKVKFLGKLKVIEKIIAISDVFLLPSETESFGLVALEAMASMNAIISTNSGGLKEVNIDGLTGYLSNVGDTNKMAKDTIKLLNDSSLLDTIKENAVNHAKSFDLSKVLPQYEKIYNSLLEK